MMYLKVEDDHNLRVRDRTVEYARRKENHRFGDPQWNDLIDVCDVLWVEWEDGIAYRRGLGRMLKSAWYAVKIEEIDLVLG